MYDSNASGALGGLLCGLPAVQATTMATLNQSTAPGPADTMHASPNPLASAGLLEAMIPQFSLFASIVRDVLGLDVGLVMTTLGVLYGLSVGFRSLYSMLRSVLDSYYTSSIVIRDEDSIYNHVMEWLKTQRLTTENMHLTAETDYSTPPDDEPDTRDGFVNFSRWWRRAAPRFAPAHGVHWFRHDGRFFEFSRSRKDLEEVMPWGSTRARVEETLVISCFGRSTAPIKNLLQACKDAYYAREISLTYIHRPSGSSGGKTWDLVASRRSRPIETVVLDAAQKNVLLSDMDEFLRPVTATWYAERGIPYRRGYLFHGPPGTGKTSLSFAAAGLFGLDVFCMSLMDPTLTEEDLLSLFAELPTRCIVLLEDVDTAGLAKRSGLSGDDDEKKDDKKDTKEDTPPPPKDDDSSLTKHRTDGISLSGLLNAIDGVASHEGRILVLTTNKPSALDAALRRPGRVDREVVFANATRAQIKDLFLRMYAGVAAATPEIAEKFAEQLDDDKWSPAEIQGFLLTRKTEPLVAVQEIGAWRTKQLEAKGKKVEETKEKKDEKRTEMGWKVPWIAL